MASRSVAKDHDPHLDAQIAAGELFIKKLKSETSKCEVSTWSAIFEAQEPPEKRRALDAGIDEWAKALCAAAVKYYDTCFVDAARTLRHFHLYIRIASGKRCGSSPQAGSFRRTFMVEFGCARRTLRRRRRPGAARGGAAGTRF